MRTVAILLALTGLLAADDWPQWMGPQRDGVWRETGIVQKLPADPKPLWNQPVGLGYAGPAVAGGRVFVHDRELASGAGNPANAFARSEVPGNERVLCFEAATGKPLWKHEYPCTYKISYAAGPRCTPSVDGERVYTLGAMGDLLCLNAANGSIIWKKNLVDDFNGSVPVWGYACHPLIDGDKLIVVGGGPDSLIIAFDKLTGSVKWKSQSCPGDFGYGPPIIETFHGQRQLIEWHARAVVAIDPETGSRLWQVPFESKAALTVPVPRKVGEDRLFCTSFYHGAFMLKITKDGADFDWKSKAKGERPSQTTDLSSIMGTPIVDGDTIYGVDSYGEFRGLDLSGKRLWSTMKPTRGKLTPPKVTESETPAESERWSNAFIVKNGERYFLFNEQGDLITANLSPKGYEETSRAHLIDPVNTMAGRGRKVVWMHPAFADRKVFVRNDAEMMCYDLKEPKN